MGLIGTPPSQYSQFAISYFREQARVWYSSWSPEEKVRNSDWNRFKSTLLTRFRPVDQARTARIQLSTIRQTSSVAAYNTAFITVIQYIHDMSVADQLHHYMSGLKDQVVEKLITIDFDSLDASMNCAVRIDALTYAHRRTAPSGSNNHGQRNTYANRHGNNRPAVQVNNVHAVADGTTSDEDAAPATVNVVRIGKLTPEQRTKLMREGRCFRCREPGHMSNMCPRNTQSSGPPPSKPSVAIAKPKNL